MKQILAAIFLLLSLLTKSQVTISNLKLTDTSLNYLYIGVDNAVSISGKGFNPVTSQVSISGGGASLTLINVGKYVVRANTVTDDCIITVAGRSGKIIARKVFKVRTIPDPVVTLAGLRDTVLAKSRILLNPFLSVILPGSYIKDYILVLSFKMTYINGGDSIDVVNSGNRLSEEQIKMIKNAEPGTKIVFDDIRAVGPDNRARKLPPFWIKIE